jgi:hypothetical protein
MGALEKNAVRRGDIPLASLCLAILAVSLAVATAPDSQPPHETASTAPSSRVEVIAATQTDNPQPTPDFSPDPVAGSSASIPAPIEYGNMRPGIELIVNGAACAAQFAPGGVFFIKGNSLRCRLRAVCRGRS